ncbi:PAS fold-containing protein [Dehalogenimonas formicexedens]|uniref:histidine kinase n=1 Tax=Dehalogenimonas formicexedens TaxID=1839801 RepID=A0A1P8F606_9CHLR|nr:ATP-binding protein [Dehalogenimonas formicexedens]APV43782.1 PAS fold-containing protein [Dehalogenimonas formicexedens]
MIKNQIGIISCSSIITQVRNSICFNKEYKLYPLVPSCMFSISSDLIRHVFDQACLENDVALLVYGNCHPDLQNILRQYSKRIIKLEGDSCWEMLLGKEIAQDYLAKGYWLLKNALCTTWRKEVFISYGANSEHGNLIRDCGTKKILACRFEPDKPKEQDVSSFSQAFGVPYEIRECDTSGFQHLVMNGVKTAGERISKGGFIQTKRDHSRCKTPIGTINEAKFKLNTLSNKLVFVSPKIFQLLGFLPGEFKRLYTSNPDGIFYFDEDTFRQVSTKRFSYFAQCLSRGIQLPFNIEYRVRHENGSVLWVRECFSPTYNNDGTLNPCFIGKLENITAWKETEDELKRLYQKETQLRVELEEEIKRRVEFTRALVHELKTPLTPILLASDTLSNMNGDNQWRPLVNSINHGAHDLNSRIDELLDLARGEVGILRVTSKPFQLNDAVGDAVEFYVAKAKLFNQTIACHLDSKLPKTMGDRKRITQVISNLLDNAIKYSGDNSQITISTRVEMNDILFSIVDNGPGISENRIADIFNPYKCSSNSHLSGLGLGLALSRMIVEKHLGRIWVTSKIGTGSAFLFTLPLA